MMSIFALVNLNAQDYSGEQQRFKAMAAEEEKIASFIEQNINQELPQAVTDFVDELLKESDDDHAHSEVTPEQEQALRSQVKRKYFRHIYFLENPAAASLYQAMAIGNCVNGDFETGDFTGYGAASGLRSSSIADCDIASILFTAEPPQTAETGSTAAGINCDIVSGFDPLIPTLPTTHSGTFAARVNQTSVLFGANQITKRLVLTQTNENIAFWFSLVMQNPNGHVNRQPFFKVRALDDLGNVLDEVCEFADSNNIFFENTIIGSQVVVYSPYLCETLEVSGNIGDSITLEISTADCGAGGHWGYSYVDDICDVCTVDSCNFQGSINLDPTDTCTDITQICGSYDLAAFQCSTSTVQNLTLGIYQNGILINTLSGATIDMANQTFCFNISPADFLGNTGGFDFQADITFNINGQLNIESDLNTNPGADNDYITDADCCPEYRVLDCCTYWGLSSTGARNAVNVDSRITAIIAKFSDDLQKKYGRTISPTNCDPCDFPNETFPVFIVDENNMLIDDSYFNITWSHNPGWTAAYDYVPANQTIVVTVADPNTNCFWTDSFYYDCCKFDIDIVPLCTTCTPCTNPSLPFFMVVEDQNGNPLSTTGYSFLWNTGSMASGINGVVNTIYTVTVTELSTGCTATDTFAIECCECKVEADFNFGIDKCKVGFKDVSIMDSCNSIVSYQWNFGDGATSTAANPTHVYAGNATYLTCLVITVSSGTTTCSDSICKKIEIKDCDTCGCGFKPDFKYDVNKCEVKFDGEAGPNSCTQVTNYYWDFGDGNTSTLEDPIHTYGGNGIYKVCLTVEGNDGNIKCKETICYYVTIKDCKPCACGFEPDFRYGIDKCDVKFDGEAGPNSCTKVTSYFWDFGDGNTSTLEDPVHTYSGNGTYVVCLTVEGNDGNIRCKKTICYTIVITDCKPCDCELKPDFRYDINKCDIRFDGDAGANACTQVTQYLWDFGDGNTSTLEDPTHTYAMNGTYTVCLVVVGFDGTQKCKNRVCYNVVIKDCDDCKCDVQANFKYNVEKCKVEFFGDAGNNACTQVLQYYWSFGDGSISQIQNPTHTYAGNGTYEVCLTVEGFDGTDVCKNTICYKIDIKDCEGCDCKIDPNFIGLFGVKDPCTVFLNDLTSTSTCTQITSYLWDFGDGTSSNLANPSHTFPGDGSYNVCLTVYGNNGITKCKNTFCRKITISGCKNIISPFKKEGSTTNSQLNDFDVTVYPNPFSNNFAINFNNPSDQNVKISIIDSKGQQIGLLSDETMAAGSHKLSFDAANLQLSDGIYFIAISSETNLSYKKIVYKK